MSFLLQGELDRKQQNDRYKAMEQRLEQLSAAMNTAPASSYATNKHITSPQNSDSWKYPQQPHSSPHPETPLQSLSVTTPYTPRTTDLYAPRPIASRSDESLAHVGTPHTDAPANRVTPERHTQSPNTPLASEARDTARSQHHVSFRLSESSASSYTPTIDGMGHTPLREGGALGSAASDWLFAPAASLAASLGNSAGGDVGPTHEPRTPLVQQRLTPSDTPSSAAMPHTTLSSPGSARMMELQRQLAILRHERSSTASGNLPSTPGYSPLSDSASLRQWMRWQDPEAAPERTSSSRQEAVHTDMSSLPSYVDDAGDGNTDMPSVQPMHRPQSDRGHDGRISRLSVGDDDEEGVSYSAIPSHMVPTPERAPRHPFIGGTGAEEGVGRSGAMVSSFVRGYSYDARGGSYGL